MRAHTCTQSTMKEKEAMSLKRIRRVHERVWREKRKDGNNISVNSKIYLRNCQDYRKREH